MGFADDTNLTVAHTPHEPHNPDAGPTVTQQANDLLDVTISYLSRNNLMVHPTRLVAMIKGSATAPTLGPQGPPTQVMETTTHLGVIHTTNPEDTTLPPNLQSHLAHLPRYATPATKTLSISHQSLAYYLTGVLNASIGFGALYLTLPTTALQPEARASAHLQGNRCLRHPHPAAHSPGGPAHHGPRHIRLPASETMPPPKNKRSRTTLLH